VHDAVETLAREQFCNAGPVGDVELVEAKAGMRLEARQAAFLEAGVVIVVEVVNPEHMVAAFEQTQRGMHANKAGRAGHQYFHRFDP